jgi:hypothetical protein
MKKAAEPSILVVAMLLAVAVIAEAQQPKKVADSMANEFSPFR